MYTNYKITDCMEAERVKLHEMAEKYGFHDQRVIKQSQVVDEYHNQYNKHKWKNI